MDTIIWQSMLETLASWNIPQEPFEDELAAVRDFQRHRRDSLHLLPLQFSIAKEAFLGTLDEEVSDFYRDEGNDCFKSQDTLGKAAFMYTRAIYTAPHGSPSLAFAHGNRAAALYKMGQFETAYYDCECALEFNHPKANVILLRQARIASALQDASKLQSCIKQLEGLQTNEKFCSMFKKDLDRMMPATEDASSFPHLPSETKIKILTRDDRGRCIVADESIAKNALILEEEPFAFVPLDESYRYMIFESISNSFTFMCDECLEEDIVPFPCYDCRAVFYCSKSCREKHAAIHGIECNGYKGRMFVETGYLHLAMRCLLLCFDSLLSKIRELCSDKKYQNAEDLWPIILRTGEDGGILGLFSDFKHFQKYNDMSGALHTVSVYGYYLLSETNFFDRTRHIRMALMESEVEWQCLITALLLRIRCKIQFNVRRDPFWSAIRSFIGPVIKPGDIHKSLVFELKFDAVYLRSSLCNHSCDPNTIPLFHGSKLQLTVVKPLSPGDEVLVSYVDEREPRNKRREMLERSFGFLCNCNKCQGDDSEYVTSNLIVCNGRFCEATYVPDIDLKCPRCGRVYDPAFYESIIASSFVMEDSVAKYMYLYKEFRRMHRYLPKNTVLLTMSAKVVIFNFLRVEHEQIKYHRDLNGLMVEVAVEMFEQFEKVSFIKNPFLAYLGSMLMDLLAIRRDQGYSRAAIYFDLSKIKQSFQSVGRKTRVLLEKYYDTYVA